MTTFTRRKTPKSPLDRYVLARMHPDVRMRHQRLLSHVAGLDVSVVETGVVCTECGGGGRVEVGVRKQPPGVHHPRDPSYRTYERHCPVCWKASGAIPCEICADGPATLRIDPDGPDLCICMEPDCWDEAMRQVREWAGELVAREPVPQEPAPMLVDRKAVR